MVTIHAKHATKSDYDTVGYYKSKIEALVQARGLGLQEEIRLRSLYFRVSLLGACNLSCPFCHNEGGPKTGIIDQEILERSVIETKGMGFSRLQFTGGEPLIHPKITDYVRFARRWFQNVGVTTNGTYLSEKLLPLVDAGLTQLHISLQAEELASERDNGQWHLPAWLDRALRVAAAYDIKVKLNLPVSPDYIHHTTAMLQLPECQALDIQLFSILPWNAQDTDPKTNELDQAAEIENTRRCDIGSTGRIIVRGYREPVGLRCTTCLQKPNCREQSHSLRLGVDRKLRPCLATRSWDIYIKDVHLIRRDIYAATLLSLDYSWPDLPCGA